MRQVLDSLALCFMWFTRIPILWKISNAAYVQLQSLAWLPMVGILVGVLATTLTQLAIGWPIWLSATLAVAVTIWLTGALHEDGWADGWDAIGAGGDATKKLAVLKDPRLGTFGVIGLLLSLAIQVFTLATLVQQEKQELFVLAHAASRLPLALLAWTIPYARQGSEAKASFLQNKPAQWAWGIWLLWIPILLYWGYSENTLWWMVALGSIIIPVLVSIPWKRSLGGMTGDIYGFCQQAGLLFGLLVATWRFS